MPDWVRCSSDAIGFYPNWLELPRKVGCLNNLYLRENYRCLGIGTKMLEMSLKWLENTVDLIFVYISNGNDDALDFYIKHGFTFSHEVFGGFIKAAYKRVV